MVAEAVSGGAVSGATHATTPRSGGNSAASPARDALAGKHVCPFCGTVNPNASQPCPRCTMEDTPATRQATKTRIGPWYVLQSRNPAAPGMRFATLLALVAKGQITPKSVVRGPTTHQLWRFAAHVRGLSREFGLCYSCGEQIERQSTLCPHCERSQEPPPNPDTLLESRDSVVMTTPTPAPIAAAMPGTNGGAPNGRPVPGQRIPPPQQSPAPQTASGARHEYEIPTPPAPTPRARPSAMTPAAAAAAAAPMPVTPQPAPAPVPAPAAVPAPVPAHSGGEYAERLRSLNNGDVPAAPRPRSDYRHDPRTLSAMELASALQHEGDFEDRPVSVRRFILFVVLLALVGGGVFLYLSPDYRVKFTAWAQTQWSTLRDRFQLQKTPTTPANPTKSAQPPVANANGKNPDVTPGDRTAGGSPGPTIVTKTPQHDVVRDAGRDAARDPGQDSANAGQTGNPLRGGPTSTAQKPASGNDARADGKTGNDSKLNPADSKGGNDPKLVATDKQPNPSDRGSQPDSQQSSGGTLPSTAGTATKPPMPAGFPDLTTASTDEILEFQKKLYNQALDFEFNGDFAQALDCYNKIKLLPAYAHPTSLQVNIDRVKRQKAEAGK